MAKKPETWMLKGLFFSLLIVVFLLFFYSRMSSNNNLMNAGIITKKNTADNATAKIYVSSDVNSSSDDRVIFREAIVLETPTIIDGSEGECLKVKARPKAMGLDKFIEFIIIPKYALKGTIQKGDTIKYMEGHTAAKDGTLHANSFRIYIP